MCCDLNLLNLKFILVRKAKFGSKFNYIDFILKKVSKPKMSLEIARVLAREAGLKLISGWARFVRPNLCFKFKVLISVDEKIAHYRF